MEKSWNFEVFWNLWKSHRIWTKIWKGHGKSWTLEIRVMEVINLN